MPHAAPECAGQISHYWPTRAGNVRAASRHTSAAAGNAQFRTLRVRVLLWRVNVTRRKDERFKDLPRSRRVVILNEVKDPAYVLPSHILYRVIIRALWGSLAC